MLAQGEQGLDGDCGFVHELRRVGLVTDLGRYEQALKSQRTWWLMIQVIRHTAIASVIVIFIYEQVAQIDLNVINIAIFIWVALTAFLLIFCLSGHIHRHFRILKSICGDFSESDTAVIKEALSIRLKHRSSYLPVYAPESELIRMCVLVLSDKGNSRLCSEIMDLVERKE